MATTDVLEKIDEALSEQKHAAEETDSLAKKFSEVASMVTRWKEYCFRGKRPDGEDIRPSDGSEGQIDINRRVPTLEEICVAQQRWLAATEALQKLVDSATPEQYKWIQSRHPELKWSDRRYGPDQG